ncbi:hypothetical protein I4U23_021049 [Adineta vaga]|nr:hypothetical protein I4U23_021049 [Adineta vaga]
MSVAEIRKRFAEMPVIMGSPSPKVPVIRGESKVDLSESEHSKSNGSRRPSEDARSATIDSDSASSEAAHEMLSPSIVNLARVIHSGTNHPKPPAQLPASASQNRNEVTQSSSKHTPPSESVRPTTKSGKQPVPVPVSNRNELDKTYSNSLSVTLDGVLPSKCMFYEFENILSDYQQRDPRTIICSKQKPTMPQVITNEIHNLQRYSNT